MISQRTNHTPAIHLSKIVVLVSLAIYEISSEEIGAIEPVWLPKSWRSSSESPIGVLADTV